MSYRRTMGILAFMLIIALTVPAGIARAVSFSSPGSASTIEAPAFYPPSNSPSYPEGTPGASDLDRGNSGASTPSWSY